MRSWNEISSAVLKKQQTLGYHFSPERYLVCHLKNIQAHFILAETSFRIHSQTKEITQQLINFW